MIRRANRNDTDQILRLLTQVNEVHARLRPDLFRLGTKYSAEELEEIFEEEDRPVFVLEEEGVIRGYLFAWILPHRDDRILVPSTEFYIDDLCVDEAARGQHVASELFAYAKEYAKENGCYHITLHVWEGNDSALAFYRAMGMTPQKTKLEYILSPPC